MQRRAAIAFSILTPLVGLPDIAFTQPASKVWRIGYIGFASQPIEGEEQIFAGLRALGYIEGRNLQVETRWARGDVNKLADLASELVRLKVDLFVATSTPVANAVRRLTSTIPIVLSATAIAEGAGLVDTLAHPGGNVTGLTIMSAELAAKKLQLLQEIAPGVSRIGVFPYINSLTPATKQLMAQLDPVARQSGVRLLWRDINSSADIESAFASLKADGAQALLVSATPINFENRLKIVALASQYRLPTLYEGRSFSDAGGLLSYGPDFKVIYRRTASVIDKIFRGANPADIPVERPTRFELVVNRGTARALGVTIPLGILLIADEVIG